MCNLDFNLYYDCVLSMLNAIIIIITNYLLNRLFLTPETVRSLVLVRDLGIYLFIYFFFWGGGWGAENKHRGSQLWSRRCFR